jgi:ketosteroid isomerase-like protein
MSMIERQWALNFAREWIEAWNSHDLERIFSHYTEDFEMTSPLIAERKYEPGGTLKGKSAVRPYWSHGLTVEPPLRFELMDVLVSVRSITIYYRSIGRRIVAEVLEFNDRGEVVRGAAYYSITE